MQVEIGHQNVAHGVERHSPRHIEETGHGHLAAPLGDEDAVPTEELDAVIARVGHQDVAHAVAGHVPRVQKLTNLGTWKLSFCRKLLRQSMHPLLTLFSKRKQKLPVSVKHLHPMVIFIRHDHVIVRIACYRRRSVKLTVLTTMASEL